MAKNLFCFALALWCLAVSPVVAQSDEYSQPLCDRVAIEGGGGFPSCWSIDVQAVLEQVLFVGIAGQGTYISRTYYESDVTQTNINTIDAVLGVCIPAGRSWVSRRMSGTGFGGFLGFCYVDEKYGDLPYHLGAYVNVVYNFKATKSMTVGPYVRPLISYISTNADQHGLAYHYTGDHKVFQLNWGLRLTLQI